MITVKHENIFILNIYFKSTSISNRRLKRTIGMFGSNRCNFSRSGSSCEEETTATYISVPGIPCVDNVNH